MGHDSWTLRKPSVPPLRSSLVGGVFVLLHIMGRITIVQSPDGVHQLVVVLVGGVFALGQRIAVVNGALIGGSGPQSGDDQLPLVELLADLAGSESTLGNGGHLSNT